MTLKFNTVRAVVKVHVLYMKSLEVGKDEWRGDGW